MSNPSYEGLPLSNSFALVIVKSHASQHLAQSLDTLDNLGTCVGDLFILHVAHCGPSDTESVQLARLGVRTHVREIDATRLSETLNVVASAMQQSILVFLRAGDQLPSGFLPAMSNAVAAAPEGGLFYPQALELNASQFPVRVLANKPASEIKTESHMQEPCVFSGMTVRKSHFLTMGGFHTGCQLVSELDFWLRTYLTSSAALVHVPGLQVSVQKPDTTWVMKNGARFVLEWSTLVRQFAGWSNPQTLMEYIDTINGISDQHPELKASLHEHLCDMANRLLFMINPADRNVLQPWLQNSIGVSTLRPELKAVDLMFASEWSVDAETLPNLYDGGFSIYSAGSFCHAAQVLKDLALRSHTGPFDWVFSSAAVATHMFEDRFKTFLDPAYFRAVAEEDKTDPSSNVCDHLYYKEHFGVKFMFNHHKPFEKKDAEFFRDAVQAIESDLDGEQPCILFHIARMNGKPEDFLALWNSMKHYAAPKRLVVVRFVEVTGERYLGELIQLVRHQDPDVLEFLLPVISKTNGVHFADPRDNRRLRRLVYSYTQLALSEIHSMSSGCRA